MHKIILLNIMAVGILFHFLLDDENVSNNESIILNTSLYDPNFNWYNTNGSLAVIYDNSVIFNGSNRTNVYQDAVSLTSINAGNRVELYTEISFNITDYSYTGKDEFAIFTTSDIKNYDKHEFGFTLSEEDGVLYAYVQSPELERFFIWYPLVKTENDTIYKFKAVYSSNPYPSVKFYLDNKFVWEHKFADIRDMDMYVVMTSHKISKGIDLSNNLMRVYSLYLRS